MLLARCQDNDQVRLDVIYVSSNKIINNKSHDIEQLINNNAGISDDYLRWVNADSCYTYAGKW